MATVHNEENSEAQIGDRRKDVFRFDRSISLGTLLSIGAVIVSIVIAYNGITKQLDHIERAALKADVMWEHFVKEHNDISSEDWKALR